MNIFSKVMADSEPEITPLDIAKKVDEALVRAQQTLERLEKKSVTGYKIEPEPRLCLEYAIRKRGVSAMREAAI